MYFTLLKIQTIIAIIKPYSESMILTSQNSPPPMNPKLQECLEDYVFAYYDGHENPALHGGKYPGNVGLMDWNENEWFDY